MKLKNIIRAEVNKKLNRYISELLRKNGNRPISALHEVKREINELKSIHSHKKEFLNSIAEYLTAGIYADALTQLDEIFLKEELTRKDFIIMAQMIRSMPKGDKQNAVLDFAIRLSKLQNPRFDEDRFRHAALGEGVIREQDEEQDDFAKEVEDERARQEARERAEERREEEERDRADYEREQGFGPAIKEDADRKESRKGGEVWVSSASRRGAPEWGAKNRVTDVIRYFEDKEDAQKWANDNTPFIDKPRYSPGGLTPIF